MRGMSNLAAKDNVTSGPFYHGTKADLKPGDLITPGHGSNYSHGERTSPWVYMSATLSPWGPNSPGVTVPAGSTSLSPRVRS